MFCIIIFLANNLLLFLTTDQQKLFYMPSILELKRSACQESGFSMYIVLKSIEDWNEFCFLVHRSCRKGWKRKKQFVGRPRRRIEPDIRRNFCPKPDQRNRIRPARTLDSKRNCEG
jgi:hypothetical protein